jgi:hypothetical protein
LRSVYPAIGRDRQRPVGLGTRANLTPLDIVPRVMLTFAPATGRTVAAVAAVAALPEVDADRIGLLGGSQGGWIAPLAAGLDDRIRPIATFAGPGVSVADHGIRVPDPATGGLRRAPGLFELITAWFVRTLDA